MEFGLYQHLLVTREKELFDRVRIDEVEETGDGRILHVTSVMHTKNRKYKIGEVRDETWAILSGKSLPDAKLCHDLRLPTLVLEIV